MGKGKPVSRIQLERSNGDQHRRRTRRTRMRRREEEGEGEKITVKEDKPLGLTKLPRQDLLNNKTKYQVPETFFRVICQGFKGDLNVHICVVFGCLSGMEG